MEPLSTLALVAAFLAPIPLTKRPDWTSECNLLVASLTSPLETTSIVSKVAVETDLIVKPTTAAIYFDKRELLIAEVEAYKELRAGWDGEGSCSTTHASVDTAKAFIGSYPGGLPLPTPMLSSSGEVGFYWDLEQGYADISFEPDGAASFFSRTHSGNELFQPGLNQASFRRAWYFEVLGALAASTSIAA